MNHLKALIKKETLQIIRDPSTMLIAFVLPLILLFIFGYGVNLDSNRIKIGIVLEDTNSDTMSLISAFSNSKFLDITIGRNRIDFEKKLIAGKIRGIVIIPQDFKARSLDDHSQLKIQTITDGSEPNIASFVNNYTQGIVQIWRTHQLENRGQAISSSIISVDSRFWYNTELKSKNFLIPGSIAIIMTLIGTLLTSLVIAREWERGTMEALMATPVTIRTIVLGKIIPYFILGTVSALICWGIAVFWYDVPFRGSLWLLLLVTSVFLISALGQGLLISSLAKNQQVASQLALVSAFLPAFMLSGFIFEIASMPFPIRIFTHIFAARYLVTSLQTLFLVGNVPPLLIQLIAIMALIGLIFILLTIKKTVKRLD
ncbi:MAG: ABC transporter permease [Alphaproteobacteria bacterium]